LNNRIIRHFFAITLLLSALLISGFAGAEGIMLFPTATEAQSHCPNDEVVWLNTSTGIWHTKWQRWYGMTKHGAYVCKSEAMTAGNRASLRG
jgi:hypothetical protein